MASTLYIQIPSKTVAETTENCFEQPFKFCLASSEKNILQQGNQSLAALKQVAQSAQQVVLLLAASDVNYMSVAVPPLPLAKLMAALPNMLEDQVLADPSQLFFICKPPKNGQAMVAIVSRAWIETLLEHTKILQAKRLAAYAISASMLISTEENSASVLVELDNDFPNRIIEISVRSSLDQKPSSSSGLTLQAEYLFSEHQSSQVDEEPTTLNATALIQYCQLLTPNKNCHIYADSHLFPELEKTSFSLAKNEASVGNANADTNASASAVVDTIDGTESEKSSQLTVHLLSWKEKIAGLENTNSNTNLNLFSTLTQENNASFDWPRWRWSVMLACAILVVAMLGLNWKWWKLHQESSALRASLISSYKNSFPQERVLRDPMQQMQQKIELSKKAAGQSTKEDFIVIASQFSQAWQTVMGEGSAPVNYIEYKERSLYVKPAEKTTPDLEQLKNALKNHALKIEVNDGIYKISADKGDGL